MRRYISIMLVSLAVLTACARPVRITEPPVRNADVYPNAQSAADMTVAVDAISDPERTRQYFGVDVTKEDMLPVMIVFTNRGDHQFLVKPSDILLLEGDSVLDPVPLERVEQKVRGGLNLIMRETWVRPKSNYQGVLFFNVRKKEPGLYAKVERLFIDQLKMRVAVTNRDSGERIHFEPFRLSGF